MGLLPRTQAYNPTTLENNNIYLIFISLTALCDAWNMKVIDLCFHVKGEKKAHAPGLKILTIISVLLLSIILYHN